MPLDFNDLVPLPTAVKKKPQPLRRKPPEPAPGEDSLPSYNKLVSNRLVPGPGTISFEDLVPWEQRIVRPQVTPDLLEAARKALSGEVPPEEKQPSVTIGTVKLARPMPDAAPEQRETPLARIARFLAQRPGLKPEPGKIAAPSGPAKVAKVPSVEGAFRPEQFFGPAGPQGLARIAETFQPQPIVPPVAAPTFAPPKPIVTPPDIRAEIGKAEPGMQIGAAPEPTGFLRKAFGYIAPEKPPNWELASPIEKFNLATYPITHILTRIGGKITSELHLTKKEDVDQLIKDELSEDLNWYQKTPEAVGWGIEKFAEYKTLSGLFKVTGLNKVLTTAGQQAARPFMVKELSAPAGIQALKTLSVPGLKNLARRTVVSFLQAAPENTAFISSWSALDALASGKSAKQIGQSAAGGATTGFIFTAGMATIGSVVATPEIKTAMRRGLTYLGQKYPRIIDALGRDIEPEFVDATVAEINRRYGTDARFVDLDTRTQAAIRNAARQVKTELNKRVATEAAKRDYWQARTKPPVPKEGAIVPTPPLPQVSPNAPIITPPPVAKVAPAKPAVTPIAPGLIGITPAKRQAAIDFVRMTLAKPAYAPLDEQAKITAGLKMLSDFGIAATPEELAIPAPETAAKPTTIKPVEAPAPIPTEPTVTAPEPGIGDVIVDKEDMVRGRIIGEGVLGAKKIPVWRVETPKGISAIKKDEAKLVEEAAAAPVAEKQAWAEQPQAPIVVKPRRVAILPRKAELLTEIQAAIEKAPSETELRSRLQKEIPEPATTFPQDEYIKAMREKQSRISEGVHKVTSVKTSFDIDGGAEIINTKEALTDFYNRIKSAPEATTWPEPPAKKLMVPKPIAARQEEIGPLHKAPPGYFTDGQLLIKGTPPAKAKQAERPSTLSQEDIDKVLNVETEPAEFQHYAISSEEVKGISQKPILGLKRPSHEYEPDQPLAIFKSQGKYYQYVQSKYRALRNRFPDAVYKIAPANGQLVAYDATGEPMAALMPIVGEKGEPAGTIEPPVALPTPTPGEIDFEDLIAGIPTVPKGPEPEHINKVVVDTFREWPKEIKKVGKDYWVEVMAAAKSLLTPLRYKALRQSMLGAFRLQTAPAPKVLGIELQDVRDALSATHELGHNIDWLLNERKFPPSIKQRLPDTDAGEMTLRAELKKVSQILRPDMWRAEPTAFGAKSYATRHTELMADFISHYILDPEKTRELAPNVTEAFEKKLAGKPELFDVISRLQESRYESPEEPAIAEHIREVFPLPKEFTPLQLIVDMTDKDYIKAAEELGITAARHYKVLMYRAQLEAARIDKLVPDKARQTDLVVIAENGSANPWTGKTREQILKETPLTRDEQKAINLFRGYQELARQTVNKYLRGADITEYINFIEDYFVHSYETPLTQKYKTAIARWAKTSPQAKKRILPDLAKAVELGLKPRTKTLSDGLLLWAGMNYRVATNKAFLSILPTINNEDGVSILQKPTDRPDWPTVDYWPIRQTYARPLPNRGILLWQGRVAVDPKVKPFIDAMFDRPFTSSVVRVIQGLNAMWKSLEITVFSFFHHVTEYGSAWGALGPRAIPFVGGFWGKEARPFGAKPHGFLPEHIATLKAGKQLEKCPEFMEDYLAHGGQTGYISTEGITAVERMLKGIEDTLRHIIYTKPVAGKMVWPLYIPVKGTEAAYSWFQHLLWDNVTRAKLLSYYLWVREGAKSSDLPIKDVKEIAVKYTADNFGGREWLNDLIRNPKTRQCLSQLMLSLDWTWSQILSAKWPFPMGGDTPLVRNRRAFMRKIGRHHWFWWFGYATLFTSIANRVFTGKWPWENETGQKLQIDWTPISRWQDEQLSKLTGRPNWQKRGDYARRYTGLGKEAREIYRWFTSPLAAFGQKLSPVARTLFTQLTGHNVGTDFPEPWHAEDLELYEELKARFKGVMENFVPFAFSGNQAFFAMPSRKGMTKWKATCAFEELFRVRANIACGGLTAVLTKTSHVLDRDRGKLVKEIIQACEVNRVDSDKSMRMALASVRSEYYRHFWNAAKQQDVNKCNRYADALLALQVTEQGFIQSMTERVRGLSKEAVKTGLESFIERQKAAQKKD